MLRSCCAEHLEHAAGDLRRLALSPGSVCAATARASVLLPEPASPTTPRMPPTGISKVDPADRGAGHRGTPSGQIRGR